MRQDVVQHGIVAVSKTTISISAIVTIFITAAKSLAEVVIVVATVYVVAAVAVVRIPIRHRSLCSCHANDRPGLPFQRESLPHNRGSPPAVAFSRHIRLSRSSGRHDCTDRSEPCRNTGHDRSRTDRLGGWICCRRRRSKYCCR